MFEILKAYGILNQVVLARASMYYNTEAIVCSPGGETDFFAFHAMYCRVTRQLRSCSS